MEMEILRSLLVAFHSRVRFLITAKKGKPCVTRTIIPNHDSIEINYFIELQEKGLESP